MVILGLLLIVVGALAVLAAVFATEGTVEMLGFGLSGLAVFLIGVAAGAVVLWGISLIRWGTKRGLARRRDRKELGRADEQRA